MLPVHPLGGCCPCPRHSLLQDRGGQDSAKHTDGTGWSYQHPQGIISSLYGKLEPTSYSQTPLLPPPLTSSPVRNGRSSSLHTLPMQRSQGHSGNLTASLRPEMLVVQVHAELLLQVAEGWVDLRAVPVWACPISSEGKILNKSQWGVVVTDNSSC